MNKQQAELPDNVLAGRRNWMVSLVAVVFLLLGSVAQQLVSQAKETADPRLTVRSVLPSATDGRIDKFSGGGWEHWV